MSLFRKMPHWQVLVFYYGIGLVVVWKTLQDIVMGQAAVHAGMLAPWRQFVDLGAWFGQGYFWGIVSAKAILLVAYFFRFQIRVVAIALGILTFCDCLSGFSNHRLFLALELLLIAVVPPIKSADQSSSSELFPYWNLGIIRFQVSLIYLVTAIHKCNVEFLSGRTLNNLFYMVHDQGMLHYPDWLYVVLQDTRLCLLMGTSTVLIEILLAIGLHSQRFFLPFIFLGAMLHLSFALFIPYIWIFSTQMLFTLFLFYRTTAERTVDNQRSK